MSTVIDHECDHSNGCGYCATLLAGACDAKAYAVVKELLRAKNAAIAKAEARIAELEARLIRLDGEKQVLATALHAAQSQLREKREGKKP
jgi:hypothetical protein